MKRVPCASDFFDRAWQLIAADPAGAESFDTLYWMYQKRRLCEPDITLKILKHAGDHFASRPGAGKIVNQWNIKNWPTIYVADHRGIIHYKTVSGESIERIVEILVAEAETESKPKK